MTTAVGGKPAEIRRVNPYRGPREFRRGDRLPNRSREARELADLVVADRVVLLHAPSGAGKTSLIEAGAVQELAAEGFCATPRLRVNQRPLEPVANRYLFSVVTNLLSDVKEASCDPAECNLQKAIDCWRTGPPRREGHPVLVLDQFEEVLLVDPTDWEGQEQFFRALGRVLRGPVWALISMREEYMGGLDRYLRYLPGHFQSRYRLDFLRHADARLAIQVPAAEQKVTFQDDAAAKLVENLAKLPALSAGEGPGGRVAKYVEPVQLQVVCRLLWKSTRKERGDDFLTIELADVERHADIQAALTLFFGDTIRQVVGRTKADERALRDWFEFRLLTKEHLRTQTLERPKSRHAEEALKELEDDYLIRIDVRHDSTWYELIHDRLVGPVLASNDLWRQERLQQWQVAAYEWQRRERRASAYLLSTRELREVKTPKLAMTELEREFVAASQEEAKRQGDRARTNGLVAALMALVLLEFVVIIGLVMWLAR